MDNYLAEIKELNNFEFQSSYLLQALPQDERDYYKEKAKWEWENRHTTGRYHSRQTKNYVDNTGAHVSVSTYYTVYTIYFMALADQVVIYMSSCTLL